MQRYNFVLLPENPAVSAALIALAHAASKGITPGYLLQDAAHSSIPHLSVVQFAFAEGSPIDLVLAWQYAVEIWHEYSHHQRQCHVSFDSDKMCVIKKSTDKKWFMLLVEKQKDPWLQLFHDALRRKLKPLGIHCANVHGKYWMPHFTLFNTVDTISIPQTQFQQRLSEYASIINTFSLQLALGTANQQWELTTIERKTI